MVFIHVFEIECVNKVRTKEAYSYSYMIGQGLKRPLGLVCKEGPVTTEILGHSHAWITHIITSKGCLDAKKLEF